MVSKNTINTRHYPDGGYTQARLLCWSHFENHPYAYAEWDVIDVARGNIVYLRAVVTVVQQDKVFNFDWWDTNAAEIWRSQQLKNNPEDVG